MHHRKHALCAKREMREEGWQMLFGVRSAARASGEGRIGVLFLGQAGGESCAGGEKGEERFLASPAWGRQARNDGIFDLSWLVCGI